MSIRKKTYSFLGLVVVFALLGYVALPYLSPDSSVSNADSSKDTKEDEASSNVPVEVAVARQGSISSSVGTTANLRPKRDVSIVSQTSGIAREVHAEEGDFVAKGAVLAKLDDTEYRIRLQTANQKLAQATLQLEKATILKEKSDVQLNNTKEELDRYQSLYEENLVSEREVAQIRYRLDELLHDQRVSGSESRELAHRVKELEAEIEQAELEIERTQICAPFSGFITQRTLEVGQTVQNLDGLFRLGDFSPLEAEVFLSEREASRVRNGQPATIASGSARSVEAVGRVARISPVVDQSTGTVKVTVELASGDASLKPGAFVRVAIKTDTREKSILVPKRAIVEEEGARFVFLQDNEAVRRVAVETGYENNVDVEILSGVSAGDSVVVAGQGALKDGTKIRVIEPDSNA